MLDATQNPVPGHERRDVAVKRLLMFGAGMCAMVIFALVSMWFLFGYYKAQQSTGAPGSSQAQGQKLPPEPRLQVTEQADLNQKRKAEDAILTSYGWVDQPKGIVRIPIDRAIELLAQRGLPGREAKR